MATKLEEEGGGVRPLVAGQLKKNFFCGFPNELYKMVQDFLDRQYLISYSNELLCVQEVVIHFM